MGWRTGWRRRRRFEQGKWKDRGWEKEGEDEKPFFSKTTGGDSDELMDAHSKAVNL
jgi:hypothetical protein